MVKKPRVPRAVALQRSSDKLRMAEPWRFPPTDPDIWDTRDVASILGCCIDTVRRIPRIELPTHHVAGRNIYLKCEVMVYIKRKSDRSSIRYNVREKHPNGTSETSTNILEFDPDNALVRLAEVTNDTK